MKTDAEMFNLREGIMTTPTRDLLLRHGAIEEHGGFRIEGVLIATVADPSHGEAYVNGLTPAAYAQCGGFWKAVWYRTTTTRAALQAFFADYERLHGVTAGRKR